MPVSQLASESDIRDTDILTTVTATLIRTTGTTGRTTMVGRRFIGTMVTVSTIRATIDTIITSAGTKLTQPEDFEAGGFNIPPAYFFGDVDAAGADGDVIDGAS
jgi:hypothetical protein